MSESFDFQKFLDQDSSQIKRPSPIPGGTYTFLVTEKKFDKSSKKQTPFVEFSLVPQSYEADVDPTDLSKALGEGGSLGDKKLRATFYLTGDATYRLLDFSKACGIEPEGKKLASVVDMISGSYVKGFVKVRMNPEDPTAPGFNDVERFIRA